MSLLFQATEIFILLRKNGDYFLLVLILFMATSEMPAIINAISTENELIVTLP